MEDRILELFVLKQSGDLTASEQDELDQLLENADFRKEYDHLVSHWKNSAQYKAAPDPHTPLAWEKMSKTISVSGRSRLFSPVFLRIAALLVIGFGLGYYWLTNQQEYIIFRTDVGEKLEVNLPDGSTVILNENSSLTYADDFNVTSRKVEFSGEAYFQVSRDEDKAFKVVSEETVVEVLGTSFNVDAYTDSDFVAVSVNSGKVALTSAKDGASVILEKGGYGYYDKKTGILNNSTPELNNSDYWRTGILVYDNDPLVKVVQDLEEQFRIDIGINENKIGDCRFTSSFQNAELEEVLEIISATMNLSLEKSSNGYLLDGEGCNQFN